MDDQYGRDFVVEEDTGDTGHGVCDVKTGGVVFLVALGKITFEVGRAVLVGIDDLAIETSELG